jgi:hypothetical protein
MPQLRLTFHDVPEVRTVFATACPTDGFKESTSCAAMRNRTAKFGMVPGINTECPVNVPSTAP